MTSDYIRMQRSLDTDPNRPAARVEVRDDAERCRYQLGVSYGEALSRLLKLYRIYFPSEIKDIVAAVYERAVR